MAVTFVRYPDAKLEFMSYEVVESDQDSITIKNSKGGAAEYLLEGDCYSVFSADWGYREYFCKQDKKP